jgi:hypothetical protein
MPPPQATGITNSNHRVGTCKHKKKHKPNVDKRCTIVEFLCFYPRDPRGYFPARHFFVEDVFVHRKCVQNGHVGNKIWGICAM